MPRFLRQDCPEASKYEMTKRGWFRQAIDRHRRRSTKKNALLSVGNNSTSEQSLPYIEPLYCCIRLRAQAHLLTHYRGGLLVSRSVHARIYQVSIVARFLRKV